MGNFFDRFDAEPASIAGNFFDRFDSKPADRGAQAGFLRSEKDTSGYDEAVDRMPDGRSFLFPYHDNPYTGRKRDRAGMPGIVKDAIDGFLMPGKLLGGEVPTETRVILDRAGLPNAPWETQQGIGEAFKTAGLISPSARPIPRAAPSVSSPMPAPARRPSRASSTCSARRVSTSRSLRSRSSPLTP